MGSTSSTADHKQPPVAPRVTGRAADLSKLLEEVLPRDPVGIITSYAVLPPHLWDNPSGADASSPYSSVVDGGRSFLPRRLQRRDMRFAWSTRTLAEASPRWRVWLPAAQTVWLGVGDVRTRAGRKHPSAVYVGKERGEVVGYGGIEKSRRMALRLPVYWQAGGGSTGVWAVEFEYERADDGGVLSVSVPGSAPQVMVTDLPAPQHLSPIAVVSAQSFGDGAFTIESVDD